MTITVEVADVHIPQLRGLMPDIDTDGDTCFTSYHNEPGTLAELEMAELLYAEEGDEGLLYYLTQAGQKVLQQTGGTPWKS
jgi:hypothetical protein